MVRRSSRAHFRWVAATEPAEKAQSLAGTAPHCRMNSVTVAALPRSEPARRKVLKLDSDRDQLTLMLVSEPPSLPVRTRLQDLVEGSGGSSPKSRPTR